MGYTLDIGERILFLSREIINTEEKIYQTAFRENNFLGGKLKIASVPIMNCHIIVKAVSIFQEKYPYVTIELAEGTTNQVKEKVRYNEVDFGISISPFNDFDYQVITSDCMVAISKNELQIDKLNFNNVENQLLICKAGYESLYPTLEKQNIKIPPFNIIQGANTVRHMVSENLGTGIISYLGMDGHRDNFYIYQVEPGVNMEYAIICHDLNDLTPVAKEFINIIDTIKGECFDSLI